MNSFLSIPEEIILLSVEEKEGALPYDRKFEVVLSAAIIMDLALNNMVDTDLEKLIPVSNELMNDVVLDEVLAMIHSKGEMQPVNYWISQIAVRANEFMEALVASLIIKKVLKVENQKLLWFFSKRKYPLVKDKEIKEVKQRVRDIVFSNDIPDIRDVVIISLLHYGQLLSLVFSDIEIEKYKSRIEKIAKMDLVGQAISKSLSEFVSAFSSVTKRVLGIKTPEEKLENHVKELKEKFRIYDDKDLPAWLRKGTEQYEKTLEFVRKTGTAEIYYHRIKQKYFVHNFSFYAHLFGSGN
ncbi:MAG: GPP34 family phosphoprotein [Bacteroidales bacterium]|nr:GPP34 family phosphoprotein [Bacteroidales bacterium]